MKLYEFAISHYCEKVRWALDYKGVAYESRVLAPALDCAENLLAVGRDDGAGAR